VGVDDPADDRLRHARVVAVHDGEERRAQPAGRGHRVDVVRVEARAPPRQGDGDGDDRHPAGQLVEEPGVVGDVVAVGIVRSLDHDRLDVRLVHRRAQDGHRAHREAEEDEAALGQAPVAERLRGGAHVFSLAAPERRVGGVAAAVAAEVEEEDGVAAGVEPRCEVRKALQAVAHAVADHHGRLVLAAAQGPGPDAQAVGDDPRLFIAGGRRVRRLPNRPDHDLRERERYRDEDDGGVEDDAGQDPSATGRERRHRAAAVSLTAS
jgi:hypothetical protein